jgi:hypothetical protein
MGIFDGSPDYGSWGGLLQAGLQVGADIYTAQLQKKAARKAAKSGAVGGAGDFPQLGMGLAATGPQRSNPFFTPDSPAGQIAGYFGFGADQGDSSMDSGMSSVGVMGRGRFPTQLIVYTTPSGRQQVGGYRSIGTPLLWSGDFAAVRRVARVRRKLGVGHRRPR